MLLGASGPAAVVVVVRRSDAVYDLARRRRPPAVKAAAQLPAGRGCRGPATPGSRRSTPTWWPSATTTTRGCPASSTAQVRRCWRDRGRVRELRHRGRLRLAPAPRAGRHRRQITAGDLVRVAHGDGALLDVPVQEGRPLGRARARPAARTRTGTSRCARPSATRSPTSTSRSSGCAWGAVPLRHPLGRPHQRARVDAGPASRDRRRRACGAAGSTASSPSTTPPSAAGGGAAVRRPRLPLAASGAPARARRWSWRPGWFRRRPC